MKNHLIYGLAIAGALSLSAASAQAACYADYKAKKAGPLKLHYGVIELPNAACKNRKKAHRNIQNRIKVGGWNLLNVMSVFGPEGLAQRKQSAGRFYLRF